MPSETWWSATASRREELLLELRGLIGAGPLSSESAWRAFILAASPIFGCAGGALWLPDESGKLRCTVFATHVELPVFEEQTRHMAFQTGVGLPGRIWGHQQPEFISNVILDDNFPRLRGAIRDLIRGLMGFPVLQKGSPVAVVEFFSRETIHADAGTTAAMREFGAALGAKFSGKITSAS